MVIYYSPDGINWTKHPNPGGWLGGSVWYASYNPFKSKYTFTFRDNLPHIHNGRLARYIETNQETDTWGKWDNGKGNGNKKIQPNDPVPWITADKYDLNYTNRPPGIYCAIPVPYESMMVNLLCVYHSGDGVSKRCSLHAGFSRDGFHYTRNPDRNYPLIPETKTKTYTLSTGGNLLIVNDRIFVYYIYKADGKMYCGVASLRRDGFVSLETTPTLFCNFGGSPPML